MPPTSFDTLSSFPPIANHHHTPSNVVSVALLSVYISTRTIGLTFICYCRTHQHRSLGVPSLALAVFDAVPTSMSLETIACYAQALFSPHIIILEYLIMHSMHFIVVYGADEIGCSDGCGTAGCDLTSPWCCATFINCAELRLAVSQLRGLCVLTLKGHMRISESSE